MAQQSILTENQKNLLGIISQNKNICKNFYLTGGTVLAEFYLRHRLSEDLDFFSRKEFDPQAISVFLKSIQKKISIKKIDFQQSFNRYLFFLHLPKDTIKTEFTYFPFPRIAKGFSINELEIDSLLDIAVNKLFTIYQKPRARDFIDLYFIIQKKEFSLVDLIKQAKSKFDWHIDPLQLGSQFLKSKIIKDYPRMIEKINHQEWQNFFANQAKELKKDILN